MKKILLTQGKFALVDDIDFKYLNQFKWCCYKDRSGGWYVQRRNGKTTMYMNRSINNARKGVVVDHKNGNGLDNQRENSRICTIAENVRNRRGLNKNNKSGFRGVCWSKSHKSWQVEIRLNKKAIWLGRFKSLIKASKKYDEAAIKYFGEFSSLNFPP